MSGERYLTKQVVVRLDAGLLDALVDDAQEHGRTLAQSVRWHLRRALIDPPPAPEEH